MTERAADALATNIIDKLECPFPVDDKNQIALPL
jgi:Domain of unknown function (DUF6771)